MDLQKFNYTDKGLIIFFKWEKDQQTVEGVSGAAHSMLSLS